MTATRSMNDLSTLIAELDENNALDLTHQLIREGADPLAIINHANAGMLEVGLHYEKGRYFISGLIMAGEIMQQIGQMVLPLMVDNAKQQAVGRIVIGTVEGDIHFIGKDIFKAMVRAHGFTVHDLGVDVPKSRFLSAVHELKPDIVGFSCMITSALEAMRATIAYLRTTLPRELAPRAYIVGGRCMNQQNGGMVGADYWTTDSMEGVRFCQRALASESTAAGASR